MFKKNTTIILGAGSSYDLGYPIGSELIDKVLRLSENNDTPNIVKEFAKTLKEFNPLSIDFFLSLHKNFADIGKEEIATAILECEEESKEKMIRSKNHWYKFLLNEILTGCENDKPDAINDNNLSIVTFNYDVSLEYFLYSRLLSMSYFQKGSENFAHNFLKKLEVEHVYGKVKNINSDNFGGYGKGSTLGASNNTLRVIGERGNNIDKIKDKIKKAEKVFILGYGFHEENNELLNMDDIFDVTIMDSRTPETFKVSLNKEVTITNTNNSEIINSYIRKKIEANCRKKVSSFPIRIKLNEVGNLTISTKTLEKSIGSDFNFS